MLIAHIFVAVSGGWHGWWWETYETFYPRCLFSPSELLNALNGIIIIFCILLQCNVAQNPRHAHSVYLILLLLAGWLAGWSCSATIYSGHKHVEIVASRRPLLQHRLDSRFLLRSRSSDYAACNLGIHTFTGRDKPASQQESRQTSTRRRWGRMLF